MSDHEVNEYDPLFLTYVFHKATPNEITYLTKHLMDHQSSDPSTLDNFQVGKLMKAYSLIEQNQEFWSQGSWARVNNIQEDSKEDAYYDGDNDYDEEETSVENKGQVVFSIPLDENGHFTELQLTRGTEEVDPHACNAQFCLAGWTVLLKDKELKFNFENDYYQPDSKDIETTAREYLGIPRAVAEYLFVSYSDNTNLEELYRRIQVVKAAYEIARNAYATLYLQKRYTSNV